MRLSEIRERTGGQRETERERERFYGMKGEGRKGKKNVLINSAQTALVFKDQIGLFLFTPKKKKKTKLIIFKNF